MSSIATGAYYDLAIQGTSGTEHVAEALYSKRKGSDQTKLIGDLFSLIGMQRKSSTKFEIRETVQLENTGGRSHTKLLIGVKQDAESGLTHRLITNITEYNQSCDESF